MGTSIINTTLATTPVPQITIEQVTRTGQVLSHQAFSHTLITIGRGYDQHFRIDDDYIDAAHLRLQFVPETGELLCLDMASLNGVWVEPAVGARYVMRGTAKLHAGDMICIGRSRLRICLGFQPVPPAKPLLRVHGILAVLEAWPSAVVSALLVFLLSVLDAYLSLPVHESLQRYGMNGLYLVLVIAAYAGCWSLLGRGLRGEGRFFAHVVVACLFAVLLVFVDVAQTWLSYHLPWPEFWLVLLRVIPAMLAFWLIYVGLRLATKMGYRSAYLVAAIVPVVMAASVFLDVLEPPKGNHRVPYQKSLVAPAYNVRPTITSSRFVGQQLDYLKIHGDDDRKQRAKAPKE